MKPFTFSLQRVLEIREKEEDLKKQVFGQCRRDYLETQEVLLRIEDQRKACIQKAQVEPGERIHLQERTYFHQYLGILGEKIERQQEELLRSEERMEEAREDWINKRKEKMILERLRERREKVYRKEVLREEQAILDEIAGNFGSKGLQ